jgi:hypothetical protein
MECFGHARPRSIGVVRAIIFACRAKAGPDRLRVSTREPAVTENLADSFQVGQSPERQGTNPDAKPNLETHKADQ